VIEEDGLLADVRRLDDRLRRAMMERFDRDLPFEELVFDRWERARRLGFGKGTSVYHNAYVMFDVRVGSNTWIGPFVMLDGRGGIEIGDWCAISTGVHVYTHDTVRSCLTAGRAPFDTAPVTIGDCTHIGSQAVVLPGVTVGHHCVVGAASLVNRDLPPFSIAVGVPAHVRGHVEVDDTAGAARLVWER
jgi:acetyltransferase-like isoleucine patch superfamily enzyme